MKSLARSFLTIILLCLIATSLEARKVAYVIGNNRYQHSKSLSNAGNDAADVGGVLRQSGFITISLRDATQAQISSGLREFSRKAHNSDVCIFYFAGHGFEVGAKNYLVPVDGLLQEPSSSTAGPLAASTPERHVDFPKACHQ